MKILLQKGDYRFVAQSTDPVSPDVDEQWDLMIEARYLKSGWMPIVGYGTHFGSVGDNFMNIYGGELTEALDDEVRLRGDRPLVRWTIYDFI